VTRPLTRHARPAKPRPSAPGFHDRGYGTPSADSVAAAATAWRRTRSLKTFILNPDSKDLDLPCTVCGLALSNPDHGDNGATVPTGYHGNRVDFIRRNGAAFIRPKHYWCSMGALLTGICTARDLATAARNVERLNGGWIAVDSLKGPRR
jgi:hypothetical protein